MLGGRFSPQALNLVGWSTSPRAYGARWSVQSPRMSYTILHQIYLSLEKKYLAALMLDVTRHPDVLLDVCVKRCAC